MIPVKVQAGSGIKEKKKKKKVSPDHKSLEEETEMKKTCGQASLSEGEVAASHVIKKKKKRKAECVPLEEEGNDTLKGEVEEKKKKKKKKLDVSQTGGATAISNKAEEKEEEEAVPKKKSKREKGDEKKSPKKDREKVLNSTKDAQSKKKKKKKQLEIAVGDEEDVMRGAEGMEEKGKMKKTVNPTEPNTVQSKQETTVKNQSSEKKKKEKFVAVQAEPSIASAEVDEQNEMEEESKSKRVKKKKMIQTEEETSVIKDISCQADEAVVKQRKKKKVKMEQGNCEEHPLFEKERNDSGHVVAEKKAKKKMKKHVDIIAVDMSTSTGNEMETEITKEEEEREAIEAMKGVKREELSTPGQQVTEKSTSPLRTTFEVAEEPVQKKKKKKKKDKLNSAEVEEVMPDISTSPETIVKEEGDEPVQKKKKTKKNKHNGLHVEEVTADMSTSPAKEAVKVDGDEPVQKKKKTKKNKPNGVQVEEVTVDKSVSPVKKTKRKSKGSGDEPAPKKIKEEMLDSEPDPQMTEVVFLSEKKGNKDEVSIDQARRLALQRDIDQESQPKPSLGQWGTAQFDSADKQQKFLRLMGGFKKSSQPLGSGVGRANLALGKEEQQRVQQGLLGEFERAHSRRMDFNNKGAGLGFTAPSNKKFAIDVNVRKSIQFDD